MDEDWNKHKFIGNSAENIVEYLINSMPDWECMKFGVETHIKDIKDMVREKTNPITTKIRKMPDFIAFNKKTGETFFIEVKYSSNSEREGYLFKYLENYKEYWEGTKLIIVRPNKPHFVCIDLEKVNNSMKEMKQVLGEWVPSWDFGEIEQKIKKLFPDLKDEDINEAKKKI